MLADLAALPWDYPRAVQVWVKEQWDTRFQLWAHDGTTFRQVVDGRPDLPGFPDPYDRSG